jgi:hypothetical protein
MLGVEVWVVVCWTVINPMTLLSASKADIPWRERTVGGNGRLLTAGSLLEEDGFGTVA